MVRVGAVAEGAIDIERSRRTYAGRREQHVEKLRILVDERRIRRTGRRAFDGAAPIEMRVAFGGRDVVAAHGRCLHSGGCIHVERLARADPASDGDACVEDRDLVRDVRQEIMIEGRIVELDRQRGDRRCCGKSSVVPIDEPAHSRDELRVACLEEMVAAALVVPA